MNKFDVLIVEDELRIAELHAQFIRQHSRFNPVGIASTQAETRRMIRVLKPDLILLDNFMPDGLGIDLTEFKSAWRIVILATLGLAINSNSSMLYAYGAMMVPLQQTFDWARADLQSAVSFMFLGSVVASQIVGWLNLRFGMKRVTVISLCMLSLAFIAMTHLGPSIVTLYLGFFLMSLASMGTMHVTWTHLVNLWFERNRGLAIVMASHEPKLVQSVATRIVRIGDSVAVDEVAG